MYLTFVSKHILHLGVISSLLSLSSIALATDEDVAKNLATLFRAARSVIADNIKNMHTNPKEANMDLATALKSVDKKYLALTAKKPDTAEPATRELLEAINKVFEGAFSDKYKDTWATAQHYPNKLLPARFAREVGLKLKEVSGGKYDIHLTAIEDCLVNSDNRADAWETKTMKEKIGAKSWERNKGYFEDIPASKEARYILPEYYDTACLNCHGGAKGKELHPKCPSTEIGAFGGAISIIVKK